MYICMCVCTYVHVHAHVVGMYIHMCGSVVHHSCVVVNNGHNIRTPPCVPSCVCCFRNDILLLLDLKAGCDACDFEYQALK